MLQMARDAEGMTKLVVVRVTGAASDAEARKVARSIGNNQLITCSWYGADAYWGRALAAAEALERSGVRVVVRAARALVYGNDLAEHSLGNVELFQQLVLVRHLEQRLRVRRVIRAAQRAVHVSRLLCVGQRLRLIAAHVVEARHVVK